MPRVPTSITEGTPTRRELGQFLESGLTIKTPPANENYRANFDRIFGRPTEEVDPAGVVQPAECDLAKVEVEGSSPSTRSLDEGPQC